METSTIFDNVGEWDFEKYASVILYLNTYYENFMSPAEKLKMTDAYSEDYFRVPVSEELLNKMDFEETLDEFFGEAELMQADMQLDTELPLLKVVREQPGIVLYIDPFILQTMADLPELTDEEALEEPDEEE